MNGARVRRIGSRWPILILVVAAGTGAAQVPTDDPVVAQARWYERDRERPDLVKGAFEVLRFPTGWRFEPRYEHDPSSRKRILNPDFTCTRCVREKRIAPPAAGQGVGRLLDRAAAPVLEALAKATRSEDWTLIEDGTFKLFFDLGGLNLRLLPNPFLKEELVELGDVFPEVTEKTVEIDGHKRAHQYLIRAHRLLRDFWWLAGTTNDEVRAKYPTVGPFMGMKGKQEIYVFGKQAAYDSVCLEFIGGKAPDGQSWHLFKDRAMVLLMHGQGQEDPQTQNHFLHRLMHNLLDAYREYNFKLPAWFQMGMAAWVERRETARCNTFCFSEGSMPRILLEEKWLPKIKKLVLAGKVEPFVSLAAKQEYGELPVEDHMITWSWACFLLRLGPEKFRIFLDVLKSKQPSEALEAVQVRAFRQAYGLTPLQFDEAWKEWVRRVYPDQ